MALDVDEEEVFPQRDRDGRDSNLVIDTPRVANGVSIS
jgi:hypothetical protein